MSTIQLADTAIAIIPAEFGWSVATARAGDTELRKDPVIAWAVKWDFTYEAFKTRPITYNDNSILSDAVPGFVLGDPFGNFTPMWNKNDPKMQTEAEAVAHCVWEKANREGTVAVMPEDSHERGAHSNE